MREVRTVREELVQERLTGIERALDALGFAAAADPVTLSVLMVPKAPAGRPDPHALWRLVNAEPAAHFTDEELLSDGYLEVALRRLLGN